MPTQTTKLSLWITQNDEAFFQRRTSAVYDLLAKDLEISVEQTGKLQSKRYILFLFWLYFVI
jgi:hypothetical protein